MDVITIIGLILGLLGSIGTILYFVSVWRANPQLILRMANDQEQYHPAIYGHEGLILFGLSTHREQVVLDTFNICHDA